MKEQLGAESAEPVALAGTGKMGQPAPILQSPPKALPDRGDGGLEAAPVGPRPQPDGQPALRTTVAPEPDEPRQVIKVSADEAMPPDPAAAAPRTDPGLRPGIGPALLEDGLDAVGDGEYQVAAVWLGVPPRHGGEGCGYTPRPTPPPPKKKSLQGRLKIIRETPRSVQATVRKPVSFLLEESEKLHH
jgi:hypothetical protein